MLVTWVLVTLMAWALGFDIRAALLVGAILTVTGPTVINPILRTLRPTRRVSQLLRWEGIVVDPIGAILAVLVLQVVTAAGRTGPFLDAVLTLSRAVGIAVLISVVSAWLLTWMMKQDLIPDYLQGVTFLAVALGGMTASNYVQAESGLLTVTLLGILLANQPDLHINHIIEFKEHLQVLFVGALFVVLAGRVEPAALVDVAPVAAVFILGLVVIRVVAIAIGLYGTEVTREEKTLMMSMAPRGIVAAAITSIFALEFSHAADNAISVGEQARADGDHAQAATLFERASDLYALSTQVDTLVPLVFLVIVCTVALYGLGVGRLAERLGLATTSPRGVLFSGTGPWVVPAAKRLRELGVPTLIVARERGDLRQARMSGLRTEAASIISEYAVEDMDSPASSRWCAPRATTAPTPSPPRSSGTCWAGRTCSASSATRSRTTRGARPRATSSGTSPSHRPPTTTGCCSAAATGTGSPRCRSPRSSPPRTSGPSTPRRWCCSCTTSPPPAWPRASRRRASRATPSWPCCRSTTAPRPRAGRPSTRRAPRAVDGEVDMRRCALIIGRCR
ncbi:hypothetical protein BJF82_03040 [Kytococcus sp. CUA-901]|nr:hypothetical protein BJF82_03040 [Kytococcus sp. CUA-901]